VRSPNDGPIGRSVVRGTGTNLYSSSWTLVCGPGSHIYSGAGVHSGPGLFESFTVVRCQPDYQRRAILRRQSRDQRRAIMQR
jgi:hypothetical protein